MNTSARQLENEVDTIYQTELEFARDQQRQNLAFEETTQVVRNMGVQGAQENVRRRIRAAFKPDKTYKSAWNRFTAFVKQKRETGEIPDDNIFITRLSVDMFFSNFVSTMNVSSRHAKRFASAIQKYADNMEHVGSKNFVLNGPVRESLDAQKNYKQDQDMVVQAKKNGQHLPCCHLGFQVNLYTP